MTNLEEEAQLFFELHGALVCGLFLMFSVGARKWLILKDLSNYWFLLLPAVGGFGIYALVYIERRYLASAVWCLVKG